jgi:hypothetical protein
MCFRKKIPLLITEEMSIAAKMKEMGLGSWSRSQIAAVNHVLHALEEGKGRAKKRLLPAWTLGSVRRAAFPGHASVARRCLASVLGAVVEPRRNLRRAVARGEEMDRRA